MASTITITCPECDKQMKAPAEVLGKKIRCKECGATFPARAASAAAAPARPASGKPAAAKAPAAKKPAAKPEAKKPQVKPEAKKPAVDDEDNNPYGMTFEDLSNRCPDCANEMESEDAVVCLHCGYNTMTREKARTRKVREVTGGDVFMWLLPGIGCVVVILLMFSFDLYFCLCADAWVDPNEWYSFFVGQAAKIWLVILSLFIASGLGKFAIKRLIYENTPPEVEER